MRNTPSPQHLIFDVNLWQSWQNEYDAAVHETEQWDENSLTDEMRRKRTIARCAASLIRVLAQDAVLGTVERFARFAPESETLRGRPETWTDDNLLYAWLTIERHRLKAAKNGRVPSAKSFIEGLFKQRHGRALNVVHNFVTGETVSLKTAATARRKYVAAESLMRKKPELAQRFKLLAQWQPSGLR
jgi:hypothetical protein